MVMANHQMPYHLPMTKDVNYVNSWWLSDALVWVFIYLHFITVHYLTIKNIQNPRQQYWSFLTCRDSSPSALWKGHLIVAHSALTSKVKLNYISSTIVNQHAVQQKQNHFCVHFTKNNQIFNFIFYSNTSFQLQYLINALKAPVFSQAYVVT